MKRQGLRKERRALRDYFLLFFCFAFFSCATIAPKSTPPLSCEECTQGRSPKEWGDFFPFFGLETKLNTTHVTIFGDSNARKYIDRSYIDSAVARWKAACPGKTHIPQFDIDWEHNAPTPRGFKSNNPIYSSTILIIFHPDESPDDRTQTGEYRAAEWFGDNTIAIRGSCGRKKTAVPCNDVNNSIIWESDWGSMIIAHEIGHALGLDHDLPKCKVRGLMQTVLYKVDAGLAILPEYCRLADDINNEGAPCCQFKGYPDKHPCNCH